MKMEFGLDFEKAWAKILKWQERSIKLHTEKLYQELDDTKLRYDLREKFFKTGEIDPVVPGYIGRSWKRCVEYGLDPYSCGFSRTVEENEFSRVLQENSDLIRIAKPIMVKLHEVLSGTTNLVNLCDKKGNILEIVGDREIVDDYATVNIKVGTNRDESRYWNQQQKLLHD